MKVLLMVLGAVTAVGLAVVAWKSYADRPTVPWLPPAIVQSDIADGKTLYMRDCAWCHGADGNGTRRAPSLLARANGPAHVDFTLSTGRMPLDDPQQPMEPGESIYSPEQIAALVEYTSELGVVGPDVPELGTARADLGLGNQLYQENCAACHAATGIGGTLGSGDKTLASVSREGEILAPDLADATPKEVAEAMLAGPGTMPVFGPETFTQREVESIVEYVGYLQDPSNRGGWPMGRTGPWSEGAAAWLVGMGALVVLMMWIGTRSSER